MSIRPVGGVPFSEIPSKAKIIKSRFDFPAVLSSDVVYFIDGVVDLSDRSLEVPEGGLYISGHNFDISKLVSSEPNYTMFTSPLVGSGNIVGKDYGVEVTGASSKVYDISGNTGFEAFELSRINYNNCESLGEINNYRQGFETGTGRFGGKPELTLSGTWVGGYFIESSIVRILADGAYSLFKAGAALTLGSRFRTNMNVDLPASVSLFDFIPANFPNPSTLQVDSAIVTRLGVQDATDSNYTPNISASDLACSWSNNVGMPNTFEGGSIGIGASAVTTINTIDVFEDVAALSWITADLQHFDNPVNGQLRHLGINPREYKAVASLTIEGANNDVLTLRVSKWDNSASSFVTVLDQVRPVNNLIGARDVAFFNVNVNTTLDQNDYIKLQIANNSGTANVTAETDGYLLVEQR
ncbi:MAG: hypothetical protein Tp185DCM00d2C31949991_23 [Prokaryotic dsDNA virus sp.]|nr:MAG: hypothetical protein Tp162SUR1511541_69 [Prokaryotic dsDNA virus sp.]QDP56735.1 MAG: hypothetical protein Tp185DCM00d2C31949991_23 [Prokaryotic dsDNA virus sp.]QDP63839.1 MAG: hypothetical protein GOVbin2429_23 [Prokaryotic dsDNA virus sp.]|tara:strand:+ start:42257 stop:43492 length:1236 start_codon:yes stop_codon:yes gene_type:complete